MPNEIEWMSLAEAGRTLHLAERGSDLDRLSHGLSESDEALRAFWAQRVAKIGVPVYGRRIMSTRFEVVPAGVVSAGKLLDEATRLETVRHQPLQDFCDLRIKRSDFEACLSHVNGAGLAAIAAE